MQLERKLTTVALLAVAISASLAFAQVGPSRKGGNSGSSGGQAAAPGVFDNLRLTPMQECLNDMITWKQSNVLQDLGGGPSIDYNRLSQQVKDARMEVIRACNLYQRAIMHPAQQAEYDRTILDPKGHPLPPRWESMRLKGTLVTSLLKSDAGQQQKAQTVLDTFRGRNHAIWGHGNDGGYAENLAHLVTEFRAILNKQQLAEFDKMWSSYVAVVTAAKSSVAGRP